MDIDNPNADANNLKGVDFKKYGLPRDAAIRLPVVYDRGAVRGPTGEKVATSLAQIGCGTNIDVDNCDCDTLVSGLLTRVFYHVGEDGGWEAPCVVNSQYEDSMKGYIAQFPGPTTCVPLDGKAFCAQYSGSRRKRYEQAMARYNRFGITRKDARVDTFVKFEKCKRKVKRHPRVIQPRRPVYNYALGRYLKPLEKVIYKRINQIFDMGRPVILKGFNCQQQGKIISEHWNDFDSPVAVGIDASRFDQHVHLDALNFEHQVYQSYFNSKELGHLLSMQMFTEGSARFRTQSLKYAVVGRRMSGDMNTAMGNCLIMCFLIKSYMDTLGIKWRFIDNGDDCVVIVEREHLDKLDGLSQWCRERGFPTTIEAPAYRLEHLEFCQTHPVRYDGGWKMVRDPRTTFTKDSIVCDRVTTKEHWDQYRVAVGECGLALAGDMPMLSEYYQCLMRGAKPRRRLVEREMTGMKWLSVGLQAQIKVPSCASRVSFYHAFNLAPWEQRAYEEQLREITPQFSESLNYKNKFLFC